MLCRVATEHNTADGTVLTSTDGWATLLAVLQSSIGSYPPKRQTPDGDGDRLAKRVRGVRLV